MAYYHASWLRVHYTKSSCKQPRNEIHASFINAGLAREQYLQVALIDCYLKHSCNAVLFVVLHCSRVKCGNPKFKLLKSSVENKIYNKSNRIPLTMISRFSLNFQDFLLGFHLSFYLYRVNLVYDARKQTQGHSFFYIKDVVEKKV